VIPIEIAISNHLFFVLSTDFDTSSLFRLLTMHSSSHPTTTMHPKIIHITLNELEQPGFEVGENPIVAL
jgi:hypothetical protein